MTLNTIKKGTFKGMVLLVNDVTKAKSILWPDDAVKEINSGARVVEEKEWDAFKTQSMLDKEKDEASVVATIPATAPVALLETPGTRKVVTERTAGKFYAETREFERGWGNKRDDLLEFDTAEERDAWCVAYNLKYNTAASAPDWYMKAIVLE
jgi:hypothetical protein